MITASQAAALIWSTAFWLWACIAFYFAEKRPTPEPWTYVGYFEQHGWLPVEELDQTP